MAYLTYEEYEEIGGTLEEAAFNRNVDRATAMIDLNTHYRLNEFEEIPHLVKVVCADLLDYISTNSVEKPMVASRSQSVGAVSESESYTVKTAEVYASDLERIFEPLATIFTKSGVSLLYKGAMS